MIKHTVDELIDKLAQTDGPQKSELLYWIRFYRCQIRQLTRALADVVQEMEALMSEVTLLNGGKVPPGSAVERLVKAKAAKVSRLAPTEEEVWKEMQKIMEKRAERKAKRAGSSSTDTSQQAQE